MNNKKSSSGSKNSSQSSTKSTAILTSYSSFAATASTATPFSSSAGSAAASAASATPYCSAAAATVVMATESSSSSFNLPTEAALKYFSISGISPTVLEEMVERRTVLLQMCKDRLRIIHERQGQQAKYQAEHQKKVKHGKNKATHKTKKPGEAEKIDSYLTSMLEIYSFVEASLSDWNIDEAYLCMRLHIDSIRSYSKKFKDLSELTYCNTINSLLRPHISPGFESALKYNYINFNENGLESLDIYAFETQELKKLFDEADAVNINETMHEEATVRFNSVELPEYLLASANAQKLMKVYEQTALKARNASRVSRLSEQFTGHGNLIVPIMNYINHIQVTRDKMEPARLKFAFMKRDHECRSKTTALLEKKLLELSISQAINEALFSEEFKQIELNVKLFLHNTSKASALERENHVHKLTVSSGLKIDMIRVKEQGLLKLKSALGEGLHAISQISLVITDPKSLTEHLKDVLTIKQENFNQDHIAEFFNSALAGLSSITLPDVAKLAVFDYIQNNQTQFTRLIHDWSETQALGPWIINNVVELTGLYKELINSYEVLDKIEHLNKVTKSKMEDLGNMHQAYRSLLEIFVKGLNEHLAKTRVGLSSETASSIGQSAIAAQIIPEKIENIQQALTKKTSELQQVLDSAMQAANEKIKQKKIMTQQTWQQECAEKKEANDKQRQEKRQLSALSAIQAANEQIELLRQQSLISEADLEQRSNWVQKQDIVDENIRDLFKRLYAYNIGEENLKNLIHALQKKRVKISYSSPGSGGSHYTVKFNGGCAIVDGSEEEPEELSGFMETSKAFAPHADAIRKGKKLFDKHIVDSLQRMFIRAGYTPQALGIEPDKKFNIRNFVNK